MTTILRLGAVAAVTLAVGYVCIGVTRWLAPVWPDGGAGLGSIPFYLVWIAAAGIYCLAWRSRAATPWRVRPSTWSRRDLIVIAVAAAVGLAMYLPLLARLVSDGFTPPRFDFLGGAVMAPFVEEWVFRGLVWNQIEAAVSPEQPGSPRAIAANLVVGSLVFGFFHLTFEGHSLHAIGNAFVHALFGAVMGVLRWQSRSVLPGAIVHTIGNTLARFAMP